MSLSKYRYYKEYDITNIKSQHIEAKKEPQ